MQPKCFQRWNHLMKKTAFTLKHYFLHKKTSVYHIKIHLLTVPYMKCQRCSRTGVLLSGRCVCARVCSTRVWGITAEAPPAATGRAGCGKEGEETSYSIFQALVIKRKNKDKTHWSNFIKKKKKGETKAHSLTSQALKTRQIKDNMQMKVPL